MALMSGLGALAGLFSNSTANRTTTQSGTQNLSTSGTSTQNLLPGQSSLLSSTLSYLGNLMTPGGSESAVAPYVAAARDSTNSTYSGLADQLRQQFLSTSNGQSGKYGTALVQGNLQRLGALQGVDTQGQMAAASLPLQASNLASSLIEHPFSTSTTGTSTGSNESTTIGPGSELAGALQGGVSAFTGQSNLANSIIAALLAGGG